jgi:hypothetical protein
MLTHTYMHRYKNESDNFIQATYSRHNNLLEPWVLQAQKRMEVYPGP